MILHVFAESINSITSKISQTLVEAAEHCNMIKKKNNVSTKSQKKLQKKKKTWFNRQSEVNRKEYLTAKRRYKQLNSRENYENLV